MKNYLGDSVYAEFDGYDVILTTENGVQISNTIVLEPNIIHALVEFISRCKNVREEIINENQIKKENQQTNHRNTKRVETTIQGRVYREIGG